MKKIVFIFLVLILASFSFKLIENQNKKSGFNIEETPFSIYQLIEGCNSVKHSSGSTIIIPNNAFDCKGNIVIKYREFRDPYDMIINNIPMHLNKNGKRHQLESGGMFEIKAECDGREIEPKQGKEIQVRYKCDKHIEELRVYKMSDQGRYWQENPIEIIEMSFDKNNNSSSRPDLWGNEAIPQETTNIESDDGDVYQSVITMNHPYFEGIFKGINISKMGIYNYDAIIKELGVIPIIGNTFIINNKDSILTTTYSPYDLKEKSDLNPNNNEIESFYVIYDSLNTTYQYSREDLKERFVIRPNNKANIFALLKNGFIATFSMARFNSIEWGDFRNKNFTFKLDLDPLKPTKKEDLKK